MTEATSGEEAARQAKRRRREAARAARAAARVAAQRRKDAVRANKDLPGRLEEWQGRRQQAEWALTYARTAPAGQREYLDVGAALIEQRAGRRTYVAGTRGVSVPVASIGGHSIRARVGTVKGHSEAAPLEDKVIDTGRCVVTPTGVNFIGANQTRVCEYRKIIDASSTGREIVFSVSSRQKPTRMRVSPEDAARVALAMRVAQADDAGTREELVAQLVKEAGWIEADRPKPQVVEQV